MAILSHMDDRPTVPVRSRQEAIRDGARTYHGKPCKRCGGTERHLNASHTGRRVNEGTAPNDFPVVANVWFASVSARRDGSQRTLTSTARSRNAGTVTITTTLGRRAVPDREKLSPPIAWQVSITQMAESQRSTGRHTLFVRLRPQGRSPRRPRHSAGWLPFLPSRRPARPGKPPDAQTDSERIQGQSLHGLLPRGNLRCRRRSSGCAP